MVNNIVDANINSLEENISLTNSAKDKVIKLLSAEERDDLFLRIAVQPGGCSGLRYQLYFDHNKLEDDKINTFEDGNLLLVVDKMSSPYLNGATIDFVDTIDKQGFIIDNPNAKGSCSCGDSFN